MPLNKQNPGDRSGSIKNTQLGTELRRAALKDVEACVCKDRQNSYGDAEQNFENIATFWNIQLQSKLSKPINALDVAYLMISVKLARAANSPTHRDNAIDAAGYAICAAGILDGKAHSAKTSV
jgi:Domain of unknown function (DUF6378)